jgi:hypothetical protein
MSYPNDLLQQAKELASIDPQRPKQVNLRRAVSSAYYAIFHLLIEELASLYVSDSILSARIRRSCDHGKMKDASEKIVKGMFPRLLGFSQSPNPAPPELIQVAKAFVDLQTARHEADYDLSRNLLRREVNAQIQKADDAFESWQKIRGEDKAKLYLASFHLWDIWNKERG